MVFLAISGYFFFSYLMEFNIIFNRYQYYSQITQNPDLMEMLNLNDLVTSRLLQNTQVMLVFLLPVILMRSFAEEKKTGTYELLMASPASTTGIVAGKFLGALAFVVIMILPTFIYQILLYSVARPELGPVLSGYLGLFLFAAGGVAIGLFASSLTDDQLVAGVITFVILLFLLVIGFAGDLSNTTAGKIASYLAVDTHFSNMTDGLIKSSDIVYFLSMSALFLFLTARSVESVRWR
jgi:ABC-2 type transport system permease protein